MAKMKTEEEGIVFIDEIDKLATSGSDAGTIGSCQRTNNKTKCFSPRHDRHQEGSLAATPFEKAYRKSY